jgi:hypothetical protein
MDPSVKPSDLTPEQRDTEALTRRLLGPQVADRYVNFCQLQRPLRLGRLFDDGQT